MRTRRTTTHWRWIALLVLALAATACGSDAADVQSIQDEDLPLEEQEVDPDDVPSEEISGEEPDAGDIDSETDSPETDSPENEGDIDDFLHDAASPGILMIGEEVIGEEVDAFLALDPDTSLPVLTVDYGEAVAEISLLLPHYDVGEVTLTLADGEVIDLGEPSVGYPSTAVTLEAPIPGSDSERAKLATSFLAGTTSFDVEGNRAIFTGRIGTNTMAQIQHLVDEHPDVDTIVLADIDGAVEDHIEVTFGRVEPWQFTEFSGSLIREHGFSTVIPADGRVVDSGLLLFAGGVERIVEVADGAFFEQEIGELSVRAECCGLTQADLNAEIPIDQYSAVHEANVRRWSQFLGERLGTAFALHLAQQAIDGPHELTRIELDAFELVTTPSVLAAATSLISPSDDLSLGSLDLEITVNRPEELLDAIAEQFNAAQADVEEGREVATPWVVAHGDSTLGYLLIEGGLDDSIGGQLATLLLEGDDTFGWVVTDVTNRYICRRGAGDGRCV